MFVGLVDRGGPVPAEVYLCDGAPKTLLVLVHRATLVLLFNSFGFLWVGAVFNGFGLDLGHVQVVRGQKLLNAACGQFSLMLVRVVVGQGHQLLNLDNDAIGCSCHMWWVSFV